MKVSYVYTKNDFKKYLIKARMINNLVLLVIGIIIYLIFSINKISLLFLPIYILILLFAIFLLNILYVFAYFKLNSMLNYDTYGKYVLELTPNKFSLTINGHKTDYKYNSIKRVREKKHEFVILFKQGREKLTFEKKLFKTDEYSKILNAFKNKVNN